MNHKELMLDGIDAVIFDIDGTLVDSMGVWKEVDRIYLDRYKIPMPDNLQHELSGLSIAQAATYFYDVLGIHESREKMLSDWNELAYHEYRYHVQIKPGADKWLAHLAKQHIPMAVGTSNTRMLAETVLKARGFYDYFQVILTGEDVLKGKPDPYIYLTAADRLGVDPARCLVFEDIPAGLTAGLSAGMRTCGVEDPFSAYQNDEKRALANYYIQSYEDIFNDQVEVLR
jgi:16S rRNA pseudouridine516 synthase